MLIRLPCWFLFFVASSLFGISWTSKSEEVLALSEEKSPKLQKGDDRDVRLCSQMDSRYAPAASLTVATSDQKDVNRFPSSRRRLVQSRSPLHVHQCLGDNCAMRKGGAKKSKHMRGSEPVALWEQNKINTNMNFLGIAIILIVDLSWSASLPPASLSLNLDQETNLTSIIIW